MSISFLDLDQWCLSHFVTAIKTFTEVPSLVQVKGVRICCKLLYLLVEGQPLVDHEIIPSLELILEHFALVDTVVGPHLHHLIVLGSDLYHLSSSSHLVFLSLNAFIHAFSVFLSRAEIPLIIDGVLT